jgi:hypothetical protein
MAKLKTEDIQQKDLEEYLAESSDFAFELRVMEAMQEKGCSCQHGGTYDDPVTNKPREFDIRASITCLSNENLSIRMAVECKNIRPNYPLLVCLVPRMPYESRHDVCFKRIKDRDECGDGPVAPIMYGPEVLSVTVQPSPYYHSDGTVGKSCAQVGRDNNGITASDSEVYDKWAQAVSSSYGLLEKLQEEIEHSPDNEGLVVIMPILVVPDDMLWTAGFASFGECTVPPKKSKRCEYLLGKEYYLREVMKGFSYRLSHLSIMTLSGLKQFLFDLRDKEDAWKKLFPLKSLEELFVAEMSR